MSSNGPNPKDLKIQLEEIRRREMKQESDARQKEIMQHKQERQAEKDAKMDKAWAEDFRKELEEFKRQGVKGYDTFISALMSIFQLCHVLYRTLSQYDLLDAPLISLFLSPETRSMIDLEVLNEAWSKPNINTIPITLPAIQYFLNVDADGKIDTAAVVANHLVTKDGSPFKEGERQLISEGLDVLVRQFLVEHGYQQQGDGSYQHKNTAEKLTPEVFITLREDLDKHVQEHTGLHLEHMKRPSP